ncbi:MAG: hypothetical protein ABI840_03485 [bacterium]
MKRKKLRDIIISLFLISTLGTASFIVSCSDQENINGVSFQSDGSQVYHQHIHGQSGLVQSAVTALFENIGSGAANEIGAVGVGWLFSAMGLSSQSPDYTSQLNSIINDLNEIENSINQTNAELAQIEQILSTANCNYEQSLVSSDITAISTLNNTYQNLVFTANKTLDTIPNADMIAFANDVLNGTSTNVSIPTALNNIWNNLQEPGGTNVISSCIDTILISAPANGTFKGDSIYYAKALSVMYYYYYWETVGLGLLSEANHYNAWVSAGMPGSGVGYSADSVQLICSDLSNFNVQLNCNAVIQTSNNLYNSLLTQFQYVGAPYTGEDLLYQKTTNGGNLAWVKSLEDFTAQSGANCNYPLGFDNYCGPTAGKPGQAITFNTYYGTQNFEYANYNELNGLVTPVTPIGNNIIGDYLGTIGFENLNFKILIADTLLKIEDSNISDYYDTMTVVPFINGLANTYTNTSGQVKAIYSVASDFLRLMGGSPNGIYISSPCEQVGNATYYIYRVHWKDTTYNKSIWGTWNFLDGWAEYCQGVNTLVQPLEWDAPTGSTAGSYAPGWSYYLKNSNPQNGYFLPVRTNFSGSNGCVSYVEPSGARVNYYNFNSEGVVTKCGADFQDYVGANLPRPPTCSSTIVVCNNY